MEDNENIENENNNIIIEDEVIATIAGIAVSEVPGVAEMSGGFAGGITEVLSGKKNLSKGIKVDADEKEAASLVIDFHGNYLEYSLPRAAATSLAIP